MPMPNKTLEMRKRIAKDYCRNILWLDDEIKPHASESAERKPFVNFFHPVAEEFLRKGVLCHLKGFPQIAGDEDPYASDLVDIAVCRDLAKLADIVILDWHLGAKDAQHAKKILDGLIETGGTRFVVILSQAPKLAEEFESIFRDQFKKATSGWYRSDKGQFVNLLQKSVFEKKGSGEALLDKIYEEMAEAYPDYLHWAAIEIAARIKAFSPQWLAGLPNDTDLAILAEQIHSSESIGASIFENLLEDLKESIAFSAVESLGAGAFVASEWPKASVFKACLDKDIESIPADKKQPLTAHIKGLVPLAAEPMQAQKSDGVLKKILNLGSELESIKLLKASIDMLGDFSEVVSISPSSAAPVRMGSVFRSAASADANRIWICISQSCDCLRDKNLLFLIGNESNEVDPGIGATFLRFGQKQYIVAPSAENLSPLPVKDSTRKLDGFEQVGILREVTVKRLIARYWGQTTRVGINQPRFIRELRRER